MINRHIIVEGVDASGKSTLVRQLFSEFKMPVQGSEGPPHYPGEMNERVRRYLEFKPCIFDRHPCVSQPIYGMMRTHHDAISPDLIKQFYDSRPLFIYCHVLSERAMDNHVIHKGVDTPEHLAAVKENYSKLLIAYERWALRYAHITYRIGDDKDQVVKMIDPLISGIVRVDAEDRLRRLQADTFDPVHDIKQFHERFGLTYDGKPRDLPDEMRDFRIKFLTEELEEYVDAGTISPAYSEAREKQFDALIDLVYVALGTSYLHGFDFRQGWNRVHEANMKKVRATEADQSARKSTLDVIKPPGWSPPVLTDLV